MASSLVPLSANAKSYQSCETSLGNAGPVVTDRSESSKSWFSAKMVVGAIASVAIFGAAFNMRYSPEKTSADNQLAETLIDDTMGGGCREYDFSDQPKDTSVKAGGFIYGKSFEGEKNTMTGSTQSTENVMLIKGDKYMDASVTAEFSTDYNSDNFAIGLRYNFYGKAYSDQWCQSYTGYACVITTYQQINSKAQAVRYKYDIRSCNGEGQMPTIVQSGYWYQGKNALRVGEWYSLKFKAQGSDLTCAITDRDTGVVISEIGTEDYEFANVTGYQMIGTYGKDNHYFEEVDVCDMSPTAIPTAAPSAAPTMEPTAPSPEPTDHPTIPPSNRPTTLKPTRYPTIPPTAKPTPKPSAKPTPKPSAKPTFKPSSKPTTPKPSAKPTYKPTPAPTPSPTVETGMFCRPEKDIEVSHGGFKWNETYAGAECLLKTTENANNIALVDTNTSNVSLSVTFMQSSNTTYQVSAIMLRSSNDGGYDQSSWCMGQERLVCVSQVRDFSRVKLEFLECASDDETEFYEGELVSFNQNEWYTQKMSAIGGELKCELYDSSENLVQSIIANSSDYSQSLEDLDNVGFGAYGKDYFFRSYEVMTL